MVAYKRLSLAVGGSDKAAHQGKSKGPPEGEGRRKEKRLFFRYERSHYLVENKGGVF
jgi:hypothetical protein